MSKQIVCDGCGKQLVGQATGDHVLHGERVDGPSFGGLYPVPPVDFDLCSECAPKAFAYLKSRVWAESGGGV